MGNDWKSDRHTVGRQHSLRGDACPICNMYWKLCQRASNRGIGASGTSPTKFQKRISYLIPESVPPRFPWTFSVNGLDLTNISFVLHQSAESAFLDVPKTPLHRRMRIGDLLRPPLFPADLDYKLGFSKFSAPGSQKRSSYSIPRSFTSFYYETRF